MSVVMLTVWSHVPLKGFSIDFVKHIGNDGGNNQCSVLSATETG